MTLATIRLNVTAVPMQFGEYKNKRGRTFSRKAQPKDDGFLIEDWESGVKFWITSEQAKKCGLLDEDSKTSGGHTQSPPTQRKAEQSKQVMTTAQDGQGFESLLSALNREELKRFSGKVISDQDDRHAGYLFQHLNTSEFAQLLETTRKFFIESLVEAIRFKGVVIKQEAARRSGNP